MKNQVWLPFIYRDYYDLPRMIVVDYKNDLWLLDCPFEEESDEYSDHYTIYRLNESGHLQVQGGDWRGLAQHGEAVGRISVRSVRLDDTKRKYIDEQLFDGIV